MPQRLPKILIADDDLEDCQLIREALDEGDISIPLEIVTDGEALIAKLQGDGPLPDLILLDLNMPKKDGREALVEIRDGHRTKHLPVVIFTTSDSEDDVMQAYERGANSFITKPATFHSLVQVMTNLCRYWFETVELPALSFQLAPRYRAATFLLVPKRM